MFEPTGNYVNILYVFSFQSWVFQRGLGHNAHTPQHEEEQHNGNTGQWLWMKAQKLRLRWQKHHIVAANRGVGFVNTVNTFTPYWNHIDGLVQDCSNSSAYALELLQSCTKPSIYHSNNMSGLKTIWHHLIFINKFMKWLAIHFSKYMNVQWRYFQREWVYSMNFVNDWYSGGKHCHDDIFSPNLLSYKFIAVSWTKGYLCIISYFDLQPHAHLALEPLAVKSQKTNPLNDLVR